MDLKEEDILGAGIGTHWYYRSKAAALCRAVASLGPKRLLDVGAGSGFFSRHLLERTSAESALCVDIGYAADRDDSLAGKPVRFRRDTGPTDCDLVLMMDVLEHVDDDRGWCAITPTRCRTARISWSRCRPSRSFGAVTNVFLEHKRRYRLTGIETVLRDAGLEIVRGSYYFGLIFPLAAAVRLADRNTTEPRSSLKKQGAVTNALLTATCAAELPLLPWNRLAGLSCFVLARKP